MLARGRGSLADAIHLRRHGVGVGVGVAVQPQQRGAGETGGQGKHEARARVRVVVAVHVHVYLGLRRGRCRGLAFQQRLGCVCARPKASWTRWPGELLQLT